MAKAKQCPTIEYLTECFDFREVPDEHSDRNIHLFWKQRPLPHFKNVWGWRSINSKCSGKRAGSVHTDRRTGYQSRQVQIDSQGYPETRIIYTCLVDALFYDFPGLEPDHIDRNPLNNSLLNLRVSTFQQNCRNRRYSKEGQSSMYKGVYASKGKWCASIQDLTRHRIHLGYFDSELEAAVVYDAAAREYHGEFAVLNFP